MPEAKNKGTRADRCPMNADAIDPPKCCMYTETWNLRTKIEKTRQCLLGYHAPENDASEQA